MTKKIFTYSLAVAAMLASCNDDFQNIESINSANGTKGKLVEAGLLGLNATVDAETRALNPVGGFVWMPETLAEGGTLGDPRTNQRVGLCWTGVNNENAEFGAIATPGTNVFTNYEYEHVGWMEKGATDVDFNECNGGITNGAFIVGERPNDECFEALFGGDFATPASPRWNAYYYGATEGKSAKEGNPALNLGSGIFKTDNASVFEGQYVVYFPYTDKFTKGAIIANTPDKFDVSHDVDLWDASSKSAFQLGYISHYAGGNRATNFQTANYSNFLRIKDNAHLGDLVDQDVMTVIVYSPTQGIIYQKGVDAASVVAARQAGDMTQVKQVNTDKDAETNAIFANLSETIDGVEMNYAQISDGEDIAILPMLPQSFSDLAIILINKDGLSQYHEIGAVTLNAGKGKQILVDTDAEWKPIYYAVDEPTFAYAVNKIHASNNKDAEIRILRNIEMFAENDDLYEVSNPAYIAFDKNINITADKSCASAQITITSETTRFIESLNSEAQMNVNVPVVVEGYGCCWTQNATLNVGGWDGRAEDKVTFGAEVTNYGTVNLGYSIQDQKPEMFKAKVVEDENYFYSVTFKENFYNIWDTEYQNKKGYSKGSKERELTAGAAKLNISAEVTEDVLKVNFEKSIINDGEVAVNSQNAFEDGDAEGNRSLKVYINDVVNTGILAVKAKDAKDEEDIIGGKIAISDYAMVTIKNTLKNVNDYAYIHVAGIGKSETNDGRIDIKNAGDSKNEGTIDNNGVINLLGGSLNNAEGLFVDNLTGQVGGIAVYNGDQPADYIDQYYKGIKQPENRYITDLKTGIFVAKTATNDRMAFILTDAVESNSAVVVEVLGQDGGYYNFSDARYKNKDLRNYDVRINSEDEIAFIAAAKTNGKYSATKSVGHCVDILDGSALKFGASNGLNVEKNVFVRTGGNMNITDKVACVTVGNDLIVEEEGNVETTLKTAETVSNANELKVVHDINNSGMITSNRNFVVGNDFIITAKGMLDSNGIANGTPNTVGNNFELSGKATFANYTTTIVNKVFNSEAKSEFIREGISGTVYRATVNVGTIGKTDGTAQGGWPTQM